MKPTSTGCSRLIVQLIPGQRRFPAIETHSVSDTHCSPECSCALVVPSLRKVSSLPSRSPIILATGFEGRAKTSASYAMLVTATGCEEEISPMTGSIRTRQAKSVSICSSSKMIRMSFSSWGCNTSLLGATSSPTSDGSGLRKYCSGDKPGSTIFMGVTVRYCVRSPLFPIRMSARSTR